ncbi:unnamed protein product, partial [Linum tenue]
LDSTREAGCFNNFPHRTTTCTIQNHYSIYSILLPLGTNHNPGPFHSYFHKPRTAAALSIFFFSYKKPGASTTFLPPLSRSNKQLAAEHHRHSPPSRPVNN